MTNNVRGVYNNSDTNTMMNGVRGGEDTVYIAADSLVAATASKRTERKKRKRKTEEQNKKWSAVGINAASQQQPCGPVSSVED